MYHFRWMGILCYTVFSAFQNFMLYSTLRVSEFYVIQYLQLFKKKIYTAFSAFQNFMLYSTFSVSKFYVIQYFHCFRILCYTALSAFRNFVIQYLQRFKILCYTVLSAFQNFVIQHSQLSEFCYTVPSAFQNFMLYSIFSVSEFYAILYFQRFRILLHCDCVSKDTVTSVLLVQLEMQGLWDIRK